MKGQLSRVVRSALVPDITACGLTQASAQKSNKKARLEAVLEAMEVNKSLALGQIITSTSLISFTVGLSLKCNRCRSLVAWNARRANGLIRETPFSGRCACAKSFLLFEGAMEVWRRAGALA